MVQVYDFKMVSLILSLFRDLFVLLYYVVLCCISICAACHIIENYFWLLMNATNINLIFRLHCDVYLNKLIDILIDFSIESHSPTFFGSSYMYMNLESKFSIIYIYIYHWLFVVINYCYLYIHIVSTLYSLIIDYMLLFYAC